MESENTESAKVAVIKNEVSHIKEYFREEISGLKEQLQTIYLELKQMHDRYAKKEDLASLKQYIEERYEPMRLATISFISVIVLAVIYALLNTVIK